MRRILASINSASSFCNSSEFSEVERPANTSLAMIEAEAVAGTTAPALLKRLRVDALSMPATSLWHTGRYSEALPPLEEIVAYCESVGDTENLVQNLTGLGVVYLRQGLSEKALAIAQRAKSLNPSGRTSLCRLSSLWSLMKQHDEALLCAQKALECEKRDHGKNTYHCASLQVLIGTEYDYLGQFVVALSWYQRARAKFEKITMTNNCSFGQLLNNIGGLYLQMQNQKRCRTSLAPRQFFATYYRLITPTLLIACAISLSLTPNSATPTPPPQRQQLLHPPPAAPRCSAPRRAAPAS